MSKETKEDLLRKMQYIEHVLHKLKNQDHVNIGDVEYAHVLSQEIVKEIA